MAARRLLVSAFVLGLHLCAGPVLAERRESLVESLDELTELCSFDQRQPGENIAACDRALRQEVRPGPRATLLTARGWHKRRAGDKAAALRDFEAALAIAPDTFSAQRGRAVMLSDLDRYGEAERLLVSMLQRDETRAVLYLDRGIVHSRSGRDDLALADYNAALALDPGNVAAREFRGRVSLKRQDYTAALADFDAALADEPANPALWHWRGVALSGKGDHRGAITELNRAVAADPTAAGSWLERGKAFERLGDYRRALRSFELGLRQAPADDLLLFRRAFTLSMLGRGEEAVPAYDAAIAADPKDAVSYANRAWHHAEKSRHEEALRDIAQALRIDPRNAQAYHVRGNVHFMRREYAEAERDLTRAAALGRNSASLFNARGRARLELGHSADAAADFDAVIAQEPDKLYGYYNRGLAAKQLGRRQEALQFFEKALAAEPGEADSLRQRDEMLVQLGREPELWRLRLVEMAAAVRRVTLAALATRPPQSAPTTEQRLRLLDHGLELDPYDDASRLRRAQLLAGAAATRARALDDLDRVLRNDPRLLDALVERARVHYDDKRYAQTIADAERALAIDPKDSDALFWRARALAALSREEEAVADYTKAIELNPKSKAARFNRGLLHRKAGRLPEAEADFSEAARLRPEQADSWRYRGLVRTSQKRFAEARADLEQALRLSPDDARTTIDLGNLFYRAGDFRGADAHLSAAIARGVSNAMIWNNRCYYRVLLREFEPARRDCDEALKLSPRRPSSLHSLGVMKMHEGDLDAALALFDESIASDPDSAFAHFGRAIALSRKGEAALARQAFERARALDREIDERYREVGLEL